MRRIELDLEPQLPAAEAVRRFHAFQLGIIQEREPEVRSGEDPEDLHKYRVAVRRTRSILGGVRHVFKPEVAEHFGAEFRWLQRATGPTRDADVYLERLGDYVAVLPEEARLTLDPLRGELMHQRLEVHRQLVAALDSDLYATLMRDWQEFVDAPVSLTAASRAADPVELVSARAIWKAWKRVRRRGKAVDARTPTAEIHRLRIACKKLRYLLELFRPLYPQKRLRGLLRPLKRLQDDLGDFHDLEIQQNVLATLADAVHDAGTDRPETEAAVAALVNELERRQRRKRKAFHGEFEALTTGAPRKAARELFEGRLERAGYS